MYKLFLFVCCCLFFMQCAKSEKDDRLSLGVDAYSGKQLRINGYFIELDIEVK